MTRREFMENVNDFWDLSAFASDIDAYPEELYDEEMKDDYFNEVIEDWAHQADSWSVLLDYLNEIPTGYDWYIYDCGEIRPADEEDFAYMKDEIGRYAEEYDYFLKEEDVEKVMIGGRYSIENLDSEEEFEIEENDMLFELIGTSQESVKAH